MPIAVVLRTVINAAFGMLSTCIPYGHPCPVDSGAKLMYLKERMDMRLLVFVVLRSRWDRNEHVRVDDISSREVG